MSNAKRFTAVRIWNDNSENYDILEYFHTLKEANDFNKTQKKDIGQYRYEKFKYDIMVWE